MRRTTISLSMHIDRAMRANAQLSKIRKFLWPFAARRQYAVSATRASHAIRNRR
jgi:hypothetical protein